MNMTPLKRYRVALGSFSFVALLGVLNGAIPDLGADLYAKIAAPFLLFQWYREDAALNKQSLSKVMAVLIALLPIFGVPLYLLQSRSSVFYALISMLLFLLFMTILAAAWLSGTAIGRAYS